MTAIFRPAIGRFPTIPSVSTEGFYLSDLQKGIEHLYVFGEDGACHVDRGSLEKNSEVTRMLHVGKSTIIALHVFPP